MYKLTVTRANGSIEQSDFATEAECETHFNNLKNQGYWAADGSGDTWEIVPASGSLDPVSPRQIRLALLEVGVTESMIDAAINNLISPEKEAAMIAWKYSTFFQRDVPLVAAIGVLIGMDAEQLNALWLRAITL